MKPIWFSKEQQYGAFLGTFFITVVVRLIWLLTPQMHLFYLEKGRKHKRGKSLLFWGTFFDVVFHAKSATKTRMKRINKTTIFAEGDSMKVMPLYAKQSLSYKKSAIISLKWDICITQKVCWIELFKKLMENKQCTENNMVYDVVLVSFRLSYTL